MPTADLRAGTWMAVCFACPRLIYWFMPTPIYRHGLTFCSPECVEDWDGR